MLIMHNRDGLHHAGDLMLMPGLNEVDPAAFDAVKELPAFAALLEDGTIEVLETKGGKSMTTKDVPKVDVKKAESGHAVTLTVEDTVDKKLLKEMKKLEKRPEVLDAIEEQLAAIDPKNK